MNLFTSFCTFAFVLSVNFLVVSSKPRKIKLRCADDEYQCKKRCVSEDLICDGKFDCPCGSDELNCSYLPCPEYAFRCSYGACINKDFVCDGYKDCIDNSDESTYLCNRTIRNEISYKCGKFQFECQSGECIDDINICDGTPNCSDASDETVDICLITKCPRFAFRCDYGACINSNLRCDGNNDCLDGSDEKQCNESSKPQQCSDFQHQCESGECIDDINFCDGVPHCKDASDETNPKCSTMQCPIFAFRCKYGACINQNLKCNGHNDCYDGSDESDCDGLPTTPRASSTVQSTCASITSTTSLDVRCYLHGAQVTCQNPQEATYAITNCAYLRGFKDESITDVFKFHKRYCHDGTWDNPLPACIPFTRSS